MIRKRMYSFRGKLIILIIVSILVPLVLSGFMLVFMLNKQLSQEFKVRLKAEKRTANLVITDRLNELEYGLTTIAIDNTLQMTLDLEIYPQLRRYLGKHRNALGFDALTIYSLNGVNVASAGIIPVPLNKDEGLYLKESKNKVYVCKTVKIVRGKQQLGYISGAWWIGNPVFLEYLQGNIADNFIIYVGENICANTSGSGVISINTLKYCSLMKNKYFNLKIGDVWYFTVVEQIPVGDNHINFVIMLDKAEIWTDLKQIMLWSGGVLFGIFLVMLIAVYRSVGSLIRPISKLTDAANAIEKGHDIPLLDFKRNDELGVLNRSFRDMLVSHYDMLDDIALKNKNLQESNQTILQQNIELQQLDIAKTEFLANMSHELRTPMNAIIGMSQLALEASSPEEELECMKTVQTAAKDLFVLLDDILCYSKLEADKVNLETVTFELKKQIMANLRHHIIRAEKKGLTFTVSISDEMPDKYIGDPVRIGQVVNNLVDNAIKFTENGEICVKIENVGRVHNNKINIHFSISDTGIGIPRNALTKIFDSFAQADTSTTRQFGGTGLGTAICKRIVTLMGGKIWVESEFGHGTTFYFTVPFEVADSNSKTDEMREMEADQIESTENYVFAEPLNVLVAEDNVVNSKLMEKLLRKFNLNADYVKDGLQVLDYMARKSYDIILMDCQMPVMDGYEASSRIRKMEESYDENNIDPYTPIVAVTAHALNGDSDRCYLHGMDGYVTKPITKKGLYMAIKDNVGKKTRVAK